MQGIREGDRSALARAITLVESSRPDHRVEAAALLEALGPPPAPSLRVGITGPPGTGKSSLIEVLGLHLVGEGHKVAVLAIDPSSTVSGGSILGDKTRMAELSGHPHAYIRPSPSGEGVGGVARRTREVTAVCEAFGFDVVLIETVGIGQSDVAVTDLVDLTLLLVPPGGGDDLQGIKRGVMEHADVVVVTKADGDLAATARHTASDYRHALHLLRAHTAWEPPVVTCSAVAGEGIAEVWAEVLRWKAHADADGSLAAERSRQAVAAMWAEVRAEVEQQVRAAAQGDDVVTALEADVAAGRVTPHHAAAQLLARRTP